MRNAIRTLALIGVSGLAFAACSAPTSVASPATVDGEELFSLRAMGGQAGCVTCHSLAPDSVLVGPSLAGIGERAANRIDGLDARAYIRDSIVEPDHYVVDGFDANKMPEVFGEVLNEAQIDALVEYLLEQP